MANSFGAGLFQLEPTFRTTSDYLTALGMVMTFLNSDLL